MDHLSVTQAVDLDTMESDISTNNAKVTNATHTGEVTGSGALTVDSSAISNRTGVSAAGADYLLIGDSSDSDNLKKALVSSLPITRPVNALSDGATINIDASDAINGIFTVTMAGNRTIAAPTGSPVNGQTMELWLRQDATGSRVPTFNSTYKFNGVGGSPTLSTTGGYEDILCFQYHSSDAVWMCTAVLLGANQ